MNKKLLATAVGLVLAGGMGLASADVKLYGQLDLSINYVDEDGGGDDTNMESNQSAVGVKGAEDLGNGLEAFFKVEYQADIDDTGAWTGRDQYIGLGTEGFGKLKFGTSSTAYKAPASKLDAFYRTSLQARGIGLQSTLHAGKGEEGQGRATNAIFYNSPNWAGLNLFGHYTLDDTEADGEDDDPWSVGASYKGGGFYGFASYLTTQGGGDDDAWQVGLQYKLDAFEVHGIYEGDGGLITLNQYGGNAPGEINQGSGDGADVWSIGGTWTIGNNLIGADFGQGDEADDPAIVDDDYDVWRIAAYHKFSDRTRVYTGYANFDPSDGNEIDLFSVSLRHNF